MLASYTPYKDILVPGRLTVDDMIGLGSLWRKHAEGEVLKVKAKNQVNKINNNNNTKK